MKTGKKTRRHPSRCDVFGDYEARLEAWKRRMGYREPRPVQIDYTPKGPRRFWPREEFDREEAR